MSAWHGLRDGEMEIDLIRIGLGMSFDGGLLVTFDQIIKTLREIVEQRRALKRSWPNMKKGPGLGENANPRLALH